MLYATKVNCMYLRYRAGFASRTSLLLVCRGRSISIDWYAHLNTVCAAIWVFNMCLVYTPDGIILASWILYDLSELVVLEPSRTDLYLEAKVVRHAHWCPDCSAGQRCRAPRQCPRSGMLGAVCPPARIYDMKYTVLSAGNEDGHGKELPAGTCQSVLDCWRRHTYIWGEILCDVKYVISCTWI